MAKYWLTFTRRSGDKTCTKKGQKYELDRATWSTYANFEQMYDQIYDMMVEAGVAVKKDYPEWMDAYGDIVYEDDALGCKVTHDLIRPEICIVMDEVGGNTSQKGDGNKGGEQFIVPKGMIPQLKANAQDKHFTLLGLTTLGGDPVMCVIIFAGTIENKLWETGIDIFANTEGEVGDDDFFENNSGPGKRFPRGPTCIFKAKKYLA